LLKKVNQLVRESGWRIGNIDSVIVAERPKLKPHIQRMQAKLSEVLNIELDQVSVKATTNERLGPVGREEGIAVHAVVLLFQNREDLFT
ncbi:MAG: 2-C-methyl-D-erythritol 2,4-cyclodiphosphate synthase, partial [Snowella sp.]